MKADRIFLFCFFLFITFQFSDSVLCPSTSGTIECSACSFYMCDAGAKGIIMGGGCPNTFLKECSIQQQSINFIQSKNINGIDYYDGNALYVSGCGNQQDGGVCLDKKVKRFHKQVRESNIGNKTGEVIWNGSNNQNGALKFIGILSIAWFISALI